MIHFELIYSFSQLIEFLQEKIDYMRDSKMKLHNQYYKTFLIIRFGDVSEFQKKIIKTFKNYFIFQH